MKITGIILTFLLAACGMRAADDPLAGKSIYVIGDSYVKNHMRPASETWHAKAADSLGMDYHNLGINGNCIAFDRIDEGFGERLVARYREIPADADFILVIAGHNDAAMARNDEQLAMFADSLDLLCSRLKEEYPETRIGFVTPWAVDRKNFKEVIGEIKAAAARHGFPVLDMAYTSGIKVNDANFRSEYFQNKGVKDTAHLNSRGHDLLVGYGVAFLRLLAALPRPEPFVIQRGRSLTISMPEHCRPVLATSVEILSRDMGAVFGDSLRTTDRNADISISIDSAIAPAPQGFRMAVDDRGRLSITGHDSHGAAYGVMELSRLIGVSPWEWWADAAPSQRAEFTLPPGFVAEHSPSVRYRGIFINDEDWGLMPWSCTTHNPGAAQGQIGPKTNARIFELMLRLRANLYWPAMHECTEPFFLTDGNREAAEKYGIYIGGSHCEPMASSTAGEWPRRGTGEYDYSSNRENIMRFWEDRLRQVADQEIVYTLGMRGVHDGAMNGAASVEEQKSLLQKAITDQRALIAKHVNPDPAQVPQVFIPYKEVLDIYNAGLRVPDDVTLMWCDDNYGYIRHFPTEAERVRKGGNGIYYHASYWGRPHDYLWLCTLSPALLFQQMSLAYDKGIRDMWVLNVGDIKPAEYQTELFLDMAWDIDAVAQMGTDGHLSRFLCREFGDSIGRLLAPAINEHYRLAHIRKPEFMGNTREEEWDDPSYRIVKDLPWSEKSIKARIADYEALSDMAEALYGKVPENRKDTYFQLVKYPLQAAAEMNKKHLYAQLARHGKAPWEKSDEAHDSIAALTLTYNRGINNHGKWQGIMDCCPRRLPVFERVNRSAAAAPLPSDPDLTAMWDGADGKGSFTICENLGHGGRAVALKKGSPIQFDFNSLADSIIVELRMLPTHPVEGKRLALKIEVDGHESPEIEYQTHGRSEEWKENVLNNQAIRKFKMPLAGNSAHQLTITAINDFTILDQIIITPCDK